MKAHLIPIVLGFALASATAFAECPVNVNTADAAALAECLDGVGEKTADRIIKYREDFGDFDSVEDLKSVKGIGDKIAAKNEANIRFSD